MFGWKMKNLVGEKDISINYLTQALFANDSLSHMHSPSRLWNISLGVRDSVALVIMEGVTWGTHNVSNKKRGAVRIMLTTN